MAEPTTVEVGDYEISAEIIVNAFENMKRDTDGIDVVDGAYTSGGWAFVDDGHTDADVHIGNHDGDSIGRTNLSCLADRAKEALEPDGPFVWFACGTDTVVLPMDAPHAYAPDGTGSMAIHYNQEDNLGNRGAAWDSPRDGFEYGMYPTGGPEIIESLDELDD